MVILPRISVVIFPRIPEALYSRAGARRLIDEAARSLRMQIAFARRGLPDAPEEESEP